MVVVPAVAVELVEQVEQEEEEEVERLLGLLHHDQPSCVSKRTDKLLISLTGRL